jgi:protein-disulfide isomerase
MKLAAILLLCASAFAQTKKSAFDKATFENYLRHFEIFLTDVTFKIDDPKPSKYLPGYSEVGVHVSSDAGSKDELYFVSADGQIIIQGDPSAVTVFNINKTPFQANLDKLFIANQPSFGPANAPVTIVEFGDLQCPSCKAEAPLLRQIMPASYSDKVRVVFKDFPLESIHPWARAAAIAGRSVFHQNAAAFWKFYDWDYETQEEITLDNLNSKVVKWAGSNGLDAVQLGRCIDTKATEAEVNQNIAEGRALGIRGTPTLYINGRKLGGTDWMALQKVIEVALKYHQ